MSWTELPVELILLIASLVDKRKDLATLRLLSRRSNLIIQPVLWKNNVLNLQTLEIPNLLSSIESTSPSLAHFVTALLIEAEPLPQDEAEAASLLHQVLESLPGLEVLYISSLNRLCGDLQVPCPAGLANIRQLHLVGAMNISPNDVYWCMVKMPRLLELEAWVQIDSFALPFGSDSQKNPICQLTHLKLQFWIQAFPRACQGILFELVSIPTHLQSLILYDISFYRYLPLPPLVDAGASSMKTLQHFELRQHVDRRVQIVDQFGSASFANFTSLERLVLPCMYHSGPLDVHYQDRLPDQLGHFGLSAPAVLCWDELRELFLHKPTGMQTIAAHVGINSESLKDLLSREFPSVKLNASTVDRNDFPDRFTVTLDLSES